jgi:glycosyltransferase involved in cell wall biosynthesis
VRRLSSTSARVLIDVTQYVNWPARSGVQRVLGRLAADWPGRLTDACYGFLENGSYVTGSIETFASVIEATFQGRESLEVRSSSNIVHDSLRAAASETISVSELEGGFGAYLLPEPTLRNDNLTVAAELLVRRRPMPFFLYYDALPLTHPRFFPREVQSQAPLIRYHNTVAAADNVAFISRGSRDVFEDRIARRQPRCGLVARLGADGLKPIASPPPDQPTFAIVGTVEPRKGHLVVLKAFEQLWAGGHDYHLLVAGSTSDPTISTSLVTHARTGRVTWIEHAGDEEIAVALSRSSALVFPSEAEGYGLPPLEAMALGCPVIVSADLPALDGLSTKGQIRLAEINATTVASAVEALADDETNAAHRSSLQQLSLPTWKQFAYAIEEWIGSIVGLQPAEGHLSSG